jgi:hypothetical protein
MVSGVLALELKPQPILRGSAMRAIIALVVIVYIVGIGVVLSPTIRDKWTGSSASGFTTSVAQALPTAMAWPATIYRNSFGRR